MNINKIKEIIQKFAGQKVVVFGDLMLDEYVWGRATRISPESPVMVVDVDRESSVPGGAANVVNNLVSLGANVVVIGVVGDDEAGQRLCNALKVEGADISGIEIDKSRPTTQKTRIVAHSQQVLRVDREDNSQIDAQIQTKLLSRLREEISGANAVVVSDYNKGVMTAHTAAIAVKTAREFNVLLTANPKPQTVHYLTGAPFVQLNQSETEHAAALAGIEVVHREGEPFPDEIGEQLRKMLELENLVVTKGSKGLTIFSDNDKKEHVAPHLVEVYDVAGAGDTVISALTLALSCGATPREAGIIANRAAACVVRKVGVATVTSAEIINEWESQV